MNRLSKVLFVALVAVALAGVVAAGDKGHDVKLQGKMACAHCTLKLEGVNSCQDALVVTDNNNGETVYFFAKNDVLEKSGHACKEAKQVAVTGTVSEKDGRKWITATKIEAANVTTSDLKKG
jgi:hypothetical protein